MVQEGHEKEFNSPLGLAPIGQYTILEACVQPQKRLPVPLINEAPIFTVTSLQC